jgi:hypothetical protein
MFKILNADLEHGRYLKTDEIPLILQLSSQRKQNVNKVVFLLQYKILIHYI